MLIGVTREGPGHAPAVTRRILATELWQFLAAGVTFVVFALLWLFIVYLPGRTLERWEDQRPGRGGKGSGSNRVG